jgi:hypothetical protein
MKPPASQANRPTDMSDAALAHIGALINLQWLSVIHTYVTDVELRLLKDLY